MSWRKLGEEVSRREGEEEEEERGRGERNVEWTFDRLLGTVASQR